ncbi:MAG: DHH family phosphoesterase [Promethearchaeota archaeon]
MIISITHELDLDGLGSQAIVRRFFIKIKGEKTDRIKFYYAHYTNFMEIVKKTLKVIPTNGYIIISDIGFNDEFLALFPLFKEIRKKNCKIFWFDHHIIDEHIERKLNRSIDVYINDPTRCSAEIVKDYYLRDDSIAIKIASFSRDSDFHTKLYDTATNLQSIIAFNRGNKSNKNKRKVVEFMSEGIFENDWYNDQLAKIKVWEENESTFALKHRKIIEVEEFGNLVISFAKIGGGKIVRLLKDYFPNLKLYIGIDVRYNEIVIHSDYVNCRELARIFKGGGHKNRAGFSYSKAFAKINELSKEFLSIIKESIYKFKNHNIE